MTVRKLVKKSKMQHYRKALKNSRRNPEETWNPSKLLVPGNSKKK